MNGVGASSELALFGLVQRFRRAARLLAVDPLRTLPKGAIAPLLEQSAPLERLIAATPLERLRQALAPNPETPREVTAPTRARRPLPAPSGAAPAIRRPLGTAEQVPPPVAAVSVHLPDATEGRASPPLERAPLAQRRALARHQVDAASTEARHSSLMPSTAKLGAGPQRSNVAAGLQGDERSDEVVEHARAPHVAASSPPQLAARRAAARRALVESAVSVNTSSPLGSFAPSSSERAAASATARIEQEPAAPQRSVAIEPSERELPQLVARSALRRDTSERPASLPADIGVLPSAQRADSAERLRAWNPHAGLEQDDALFDALYREGVDLSWP